MLQIVSLAGATLILVPFALVQWRRMTPEQVAYHVMNLAGAGTLLVVALLESQWGFLLLEGVWSAVSAHGLVRSLRSPPVTPTG